VTIRRGDRGDGPVELLPFGPADLALVRAVVRRHARAAGLTGDRPDCLILAVHEIAASAAGGPGSAVLRCATRAGRVVCEIHTSPGNRDAGPNSPTQPGEHDTGPSRARGLRVARVLCDAVETIEDGRGSVVRVTMEPTTPKHPTPPDTDDAHG